MKDLGTKIKNKFKQIGTKIKTTATKILGYKNTKPGYPNEHHWLFYNYCGPGTHFTERKARGDLPVNETDRACMAHDKVYADPNATAGQVRASDKRLVKQIEKIKPKGPSEALLQKVATGFFKPKEALVKMGLVDPRRLSASAKNI